MVNELSKEAIKFSFELADRRLLQLRRTATAEADKADVF